MTIVYDPKCAEYNAPLHPERPERVSNTASYLRRMHPDWLWQIPGLADDQAILRAHSQEHLRRLSEKADFDPDTPAHEKIIEHARRAAGAAIDCARIALSGTPCFSLLRPPGHHATRDQAMGFCYLNSIAIAALDALSRGLTRVAIWDFDGHHGNGTEAICEAHNGIRYVSFHQHPAYPGTGSLSRANIFNFPVSAETTGARQMEVLKSSWECVEKFKPELILVSAGFDAYAGDPLLSLSLTRENFGTLGQWLAKTEIPCGVILEGGYSNELPLLIDAFLCGWEQN